MSANEETERYAQELADFAWHDTDRVLARSVVRVKRNLRDRVHDGSFVPEMAVGAWFRITDLASTLCSERMLSVTDNWSTDHGQEKPPFQEFASGQKYAHPRRTRRWAAGLMAEHYNKHLDEVQGEVEDE